MKNKIGRLAVCGAGRIGRIEGLGRRGYFGTGIDGTPWVSRTPRMIKASQEGFLNLVRIPRKVVEAIKTLVDGNNISYVPPIFDSYEDGSGMNR